MKKNAFIFALLALLYTSCNNPTKNPDQHEEHNEVKIQLTAYSSEFELYAEADPFVVGKSSNILSHFSHIPDFKALESGSVSIRLIIDSKEVVQQINKPNRKGIYSFDLIPSVQGTGQLIYNIKTDKLESQVVIQNITVYSDELKADHAAEDEVVSRTNTIVFTKEQSWKIDFATELPFIEPFGQIIKTSGMVQSAPGDEMVVAASTNGIIIFTGSSILEGNSVVAGRGIFTISGSNMADNNLGVRIIEAQNNYERTLLEFERKKALAKDKIVSDKDLLTAKNEFENAKALNDMLRKNFTSNGQTISSPMSGFVKQVFVTSGQYVEAGQPIIAVSKNKTLLLRADVQQKYVPLLGSITSANIRTLHNNKTYTLEQLNGKLISYGRNTNNDNYLIPVMLQIDNIGSFIPGEFVEIYLKTITNSNAVTLPNSALLEDQGNYFIFVQVNPELFEKKEVTIGTTDGLRTEIKSGIAKSQRIITKGAILVKLSQAAGALDAHSGHVH